MSNEKLERAREIIRTLAGPNDIICYNCIDYMNDNCDVCNRYICERCDQLEDYCVKCVNKFIEMKGCKACKEYHATQYHKEA